MYIVQCTHCTNKLLETSSAVLCRHTVQLNCSPTWKQLPLQAWSWVPADLGEDSSPPVLQCGGRGPYAECAFHFHPHHRVTISKPKRKFVLIRAKLSNLAYCQELGKLARATCMRCHGTKCPLLTAFFRWGTSIGGFFCVCDVWCVVLPKKESYRVEFSTLQTSTEARLTSEVEHKQRSMCTMSVQYCSAWPKPGTPPTLQDCNFFFFFVSLPMLLFSQKGLS
jgi:hypothetical protein